jgi:hypothetical protein
MPSRHGRGRDAGEAPGRPRFRHHRQRHDPDRPRLRVVSARADLGLDIHGLLCRAHGGRQCDPRRLRASEAPPLARASPSERA